jgi:hypothetical protein
MITNCALVHPPLDKITRITPITSAEANSLEFWSRARRSHILVRGHRLWRPVNGRAGSASGRAGRRSVRAGGGVRPIIIVACSGAGTSLQLTGQVDLWHRPGRAEAGERAPLVRAACDGDDGHSAGCRGGGASLAAGGWESGGELLAGGSPRTPCPKGQRQLIWSLSGSSRCCSPGSTGCRPVRPARWIRRWPAGLHADLAALAAQRDFAEADRFAQMMGELGRMLDRLPPAPADEPEVAVYLAVLIRWLNTDPWLPATRAGGLALAPAAVERKLTVTSRGLDGRMPMPTSRADSARPGLAVSIPAAHRPITSPGLPASGSPSPRAARGRRTPPRRGPVTYLRTPPENGGMPSEHGQALPRYSPGDDPGRTRIADAVTAAAVQDRAG